MSANPYWQVALARSSDMGEIGGLPYAFSLAPTFNRPGSFSATLPLDDEIAYQVAKYSTCVICERNDVARWSGAITAVAKDPAAMTMTITAVGWLDELGSRFVRPSEEVALTFVGVAGGQIVQTLITTVNAQTDTGGVIRPTHLTFGSAYDSQARTRSYKRGQSYWQAIQELSDVENGLDVYVDPIARRISTRPPDFFRDLQDVVFGYGVEPNNLSNAPSTDDGSVVANRVNVVGASGAIVTADDATAIDALDAMRESWLSLSDVSDQLFLGAHANAELVYGRYGRTTYDLKPITYGDVPRPWDDFELGDQVYLSVDAGAEQVDKQAVRVFAVGIEVDAQGNEQISQITTAPS